MSGNGTVLRRKIAGAQDLRSVVRTMKAVAAASVTQYEQSVRALAQYHRAVESGLGACLREPQLGTPEVEPGAEHAPTGIGAIVFGTDQGLVGQFNDVVADFAIKTLAGLSGSVKVWAVGERVHARLAEAGMDIAGTFDLPNSVKSIAPMLARIQSASELMRAKGQYGSVHVFHNRIRSGALYDPVCQRILPLDAQWEATLSKVAWPTSSLPEIIGGRPGMLRALTHEYLFISLFRACAESLASENASRLAAMQRADKNIAELLETMNGTFHRMRQDSIDEELFDVISGFEALLHSSPGNQANP